MAAGGAATFGGTEYQSRVAAWLAVRILAETAAAPILGWDAASTLEFIRCETSLPTDDILVGHAPTARRLAMFQSKRTISLERKPDSDFASVIAQFWKQFTAHERLSPPPRMWERRLDPDTDRLVLVTNSLSSERVTKDLRQLLDRVRGLRPEQSLDEAAVNKDERDVLDVVRIHVRAVAGSDPPDGQLREFLGLIHAMTLDMESAGPGEREARELLRQAVLADPAQDASAWAELLTHLTTSASGQSGSSRHELQRRLLAAGVRLRVPRSFQRDVDRLKDYSGTTARRLRDFTRIRVGTQDVRLTRPVNEALIGASRSGSVVVVGAPGAGKSGSLHEVAERLEAEGRIVVYVAADRLEARTLGALRVDLGLDHEVTDVLANWPSAEPKFLVIDALDALRSEPAALTVNDLISGVQSATPQWHVVASIRTFDLRYRSELQGLFRGAAPTAFSLPEFPSVRHVAIPQLTDDELSQLATQAPALASLLQRSSSELRELVRSPFNLRLAADLIASGAQV